MVLVAVLTGFHLILLGARVADGSVLDPAVAVEWVTGLALLLGLVRLHRLGLSVVRGRNALILWLLVLLLHAVAVAPGENGSLELRVGQSFLGIVPIGVAIGFVIFRLAGLLPSTAVRCRTRFFRRTFENAPERALTSTDLLSVLVPRAPPV
jgi:hypothetical protein